MTVLILKYPLRYVNVQMQPKDENKRSKIILQKQQTSLLNINNYPLLKRRSLRAMGHPSVRPI